MAGYSISVVFAGIVVAAKKQMVFNKKIIVNAVLFAIVVSVYIIKRYSFLVNCLISAMLIITTLLLNKKDIISVIGRIYRRKPIRRND
jgi:hypothetical protein